MYLKNIVTPNTINTSLLQCIFTTPTLIQTLTLTNYRRITVYNTSKTYYCTQTNTHTSLNSLSHIKLVPNLILILLTTNHTHTFHTRILPSTLTETFAQYITTNQSYTESLYFSSQYKRTTIFYTQLSNSYMTLDVFITKYA